MTVPDLQRYPKKLFPIKLELEFCIRFFKPIIFICGFLQKWLEHFMFLRSNGEIHNNKHFSESENNVVLFFVVDQIKFIRVPL